MPREKFDTAVYSISEAIRLQRTMGRLGILPGRLGRLGVLPFLYSDWLLFLWHGVNAFIAQSQYSTVIFFNVEKRARKYDGILQSILCYYTFVYYFKLKLSSNQIMSLLFQPSKLRPF